MHLEKYQTTSKHESMYFAFFYRLICCLFPFGNTATNDNAKITPIIAIFKV